MPPESPPSAVPSARFGDVPQGMCQVAVWGTAQGALCARAVLPDGRLCEVNDAFELAQLLGSLGWLPAPPGRGGPGLR